MCHLHDKLQGKLILQFGILNGQLGLLIFHPMIFLHFSCGVTYRREANKTNPQIFTDLKKKSQQQEDKMHWIISHESRQRHQKKRAQYCIQSGNFFITKNLEVKFVLLRILIRPCFFFNPFLKSLVFAICFEYRFYWSPVLNYHTILLDSPFMRASVYIFI